MIYYMIITILICLLLISPVLGFLKDSQSHDHFEEINEVALNLNVEKTKVLYSGKAIGGDFVLFQ